VAILNLLRLYEFTTNDRYRQMAEQSLQAFASTLRQGSMSVPKMLAAVDFYLDKPKEIIIVKPGPAVTADPLLAKLRGTFVPNRALSVVAYGPDQKRQQSLILLLEAKVPIGGKVTAYVCEGRVCSLPTSDPAVFARQVASVEALPDLPAR
jgi:uncharacterized protein YyaL (SSP411 family)